MSSNEVDLTGKSRIISNVLTGWLSYLVFFIAGFFLPRLISDQLGQTSLGIWDLSWSIVNYFTFAALGIGSSLNRFVAKFRAEGKVEELSAAVSTVVAIQVLLSVLVFMATIAMTLYLPHVLGERLGDEMEMAQQVVFFLGLSLTLQFLFDTSRGVLTGCHRWDLFNGLNAFSYLISVALMITALYMGYRLEAISAVYMVMTGVQGVARSVLARRVCPDAKYESARISIEFAKEILPFGLKTILLGIPSLLVIQTSYLLIAATLGPAMLAIIVRPMSLIKHFDTFITRFTYVLTPMAGSLQESVGTKELQSFTIECSKYGAAITLPFIVLFCFYGGDLIAVWMGEDYVNTQLILLIGVGYLLSISQSSLSRILVGLDLHGKAAVISVFVSAVVYAVGITIIYVIGWSLEAFAAVIAASVTAVQGIAIPIYACRRLGIPLHVYVAEAFGKTPVITCISFALLYSLDRYVGGEGLLILVNAGVFLMTVVALYWAFLLSDSVKDILIEKLSTLLEKFQRN